MIDIQRLVEEIHASPQVAVIAVAGAGSQAVAWLLGMGGASQTILEVVVPYGRRSMMEFVGYEPAQFVSLKTAQEMARAAYQRGLRLQERPSSLVGLGCTASIATTRSKRGEHRAFIATWDDQGVATYSLSLAKGRRQRAAEEEVVSRLLLYALAEAYHVRAQLSLGLVDGEHPELQYTAHASPLRRLLSGDVLTVTAHPDGRMVPDEPFSGPVLAGSFNPLHQGHEQFAQVASEILGIEVIFELSVANVDKPPLKEAEVRRRLRQFAGKGRVILTRAETFRKKTALLPGCVFVIGWDTAVRLVDPRYYGGQESAMLKALAEMAAMGCRFLVAGREQDGSFHTLADVAIPPGFDDLFEAIPESRFRSDISSTALRAAQ